ncbi:Phosphotransferase enzyme family protein [Corynebacterium imitans]|uniref:Phosphotransferase n=1 Tax=Corynebacterium imitans TaxID=156978 RepID=A0A076NRX9_9CORY|nr:phosphotransferase [Corynebacterium imitans]AIJ33662.1 phosphotransferase [Corynebacterium imitans]SNV73613.1 Phosphotransferase enzyme family protein [Corynebacterium imitans]
MDQETIIAQAEEILTRRYGGAQKLSGVDALSGSGFAHVLRARVATNPFLQHRTVVVKYSPETGNAVEDAAFLREVVAYQFTTSLSEEARPGPVLLGYDVDQRIMIISDSGEGDTLATLLDHADAESHVQILRNLGTALGRMHAGSAGREHAFDVLFARATNNRSGAETIQRLRERLLAHRIRFGLEMLEASGIDVPGEVAITAANVQSRLFKGGSRAFTPFDLSPDNIIYADRTQFLDYEWAGFRDVSFDVAFVVAGFPLYISEWDYNEEAVDAFIDAWLHEIRDTWPAFQHEDTLQARITGAMVSWALSSLSVMGQFSLEELAARDEALAEELAAAGIDVTDQVADGQSSSTPQGAGPGILRPQSQGPFTHEEELVRRDFEETFDALAAYAGTGRDTAYLVIAEFARSVAARFK